MSVVYTSIKPVCLQREIIWRYPDALADDLLRNSTRIAANHNRPAITAHQVEA